jgi:hypothetical protein
MLFIGQLHQKKKAACLLLMTQIDVCDTGCVEAVVVIEFLLRKICRSARRGIMMSVTDLNSRDTHIAGDKSAAIINTFFLHPTVLILLKAISSR